MDHLQLEIEAIRSQIEDLRQERDKIQVEPVELENDSPQAITSAYRRRARELALKAAEVKGIDDAIAALEAQLKQKLAASMKSPAQNRYTQLEEQVEAGREQARAHAERINQLAAELADEIQALKAIADEIAPNYWQVYYKPFITGFRSISVPHVRSDGDVWTIVNRVV